MQRRPSGIYEFRRRLPQAIAGKPAPEHVKGQLSELINTNTGNFKQYLSVSLRTNDQKLAKRRDLDEARRVTDLFDWGLKLVQGEQPEAAIGRSETQMPSPEEIEAHFLHVLLEADEKERNEGDIRRYLQTKAERSQWPDLDDARIGKMGMADGHLEQAADMHEELLSDYRKAYAKRRTEIIKPELHSYLNSKQAPIDPSSLEYHQAGLAALRGHVKAYEAMLERGRGADIPTPAAKQVVNGPKLTEALKLWREGTQARGGKKPAQSTVREAERVVRYFKEWHGDLPLGDITREKARDFRNALARLPTRLKASHRALPLRKLLSVVEGKGEAVHGASINKYLNLLVAIVSAVEREGLLDGISGFANPFSKLSLTIDRRNDPNRRQPFMDADLAKLFRTGVYRKGERPAGGGGEAAYWMPLIALLSGARLNEIAQLRLRDVLQDPETGVWVIDIGTDGGRSIKTVSSRRQVPVHSELIRLGFLKYRKALLDAGSKPTDSLWPKVKSADDQYRSTAWSKWFNRYLRDTAGIKDTTLVFHSFRHSFKRMTRDAGIPEDQSDFLTGHTGGGVGRNYGAGFGLKALHAAIEKISAPKVVKELPEWKHKSGG